MKKLPPIVLGINLFIAIAPFLAWQIFRVETQRLYFVFGIIVLYFLSFFSKPIRQLEEWRIGAFGLWSLIMMFWHSKIWIDSITFKYLNFYLMSEGFIHVFCAILFYKLIYEYVNKLPAVYFALAVYLVRGFMIKSLTPIFTVVICFFIWCACKKKSIFGSLLVLAVTGIFIYSNFDYIALKWSCRPYVWKIVLKQIAERPMGYGFDKNLMSNMVIGLRGWNLIHNDYLNLLRDLGVVAIGILSMFLLKFFRNFKVNFLSLACVGSLIASFFQSTMYFPRNSILIISFFALCNLRAKHIKLLN